MLPLKKIPSTSASKLAEADDSRASRLYYSLCVGVLTLRRLLFVERDRRMKQAPTFLILADKVSGPAPR